MHLLQEKKEKMIHLQWELLLTKRRPQRAGRMDVAGKIEPRFLAISWILALEKDQP